MPKRKYEASKDIDYQMLDAKEIIGKKIVNFHLMPSIEGDELWICLEDGKQIQISYNPIEKRIMVQSD